MTAETVVFRGIKFRRYPNARQSSERKYYVPGIADRKRGVKRLHEEIWIAHNGPIPEGHHVHHRDHDTLNNDPANLECIPDAEHRAHHADERRGRGSTEAERAHLARIRPLAAEWHRTSEGRAWHAEHGARTWDNREHREYICDHCGATYASRSARGEERFCSNRCRSAARRATGVDDEDRVCEFCGVTYRVNRYKRTRYCGKSCASKSHRSRPA